MKLLNSWVKPDEGVDQVMNKIAVEQFVNGLPQELRVWVASHNHKKPADVAELIEAYDSAQAQVNVEKTKFSTPRPIPTRLVRSREKRWNRPEEAFG